MQSNRSGCMGYSALESNQKIINCKNIHEDSKEEVCGFQLIFWVHMSIVLLAICFVFKLQKRGMQRNWRSPHGEKKAWQKLQLLWKSLRAWLVMEEWRILWENAGICVHYKENWQKKNDCLNEHQQNEISQTFTKEFFLIGEHRNVMKQGVYPLFLWRNE